MRALRQAAAALVCLVPCFRSERLNLSSELTPSRRRPRGRPRTGLQGGAAGLLLAAAVLFTAPVLPGAGGAAHAAELVSNIDEARQGTGQLQRYDQAQAFTTGTHNAGYTLTSIELRMDSFGSEPKAVFSVSINANNNGAPSDVLGTLTAPAILVAGINKFTHAGIKLEANTTYFAVIDVSTTGESGFANTASDDETGMAAWSIADESLERDAGSTGSWRAILRSKSIRINGALGAAPTFGVTVPNQFYTQNAAITDLVLPVATGGDGTLTYSLSPPPPPGLGFDAKTRTLSGTPTKSQEATTYTYKATDDDLDTATLTFNISVMPPPAAGSPGQVPPDGSPGLTVSKTAVTVYEAPGRRKQTYTVRLNTRPKGQVTVVPSVSDHSVATVRTASSWKDLTFTRQNWNVPQTVTVKAVDDDFIDPERRTTILHKVRGYGSVKRGPSVAVTVINDDSPAVIVFADTHSLRSPQALVVRENKTGLYRIKLDKGPLSDVTITVAGAAPSIATAEPVKFVPALTFTRDNWDRVQMVLVRGVNDDVVNPEVAEFSGRRGRTTRIVHGISGGGYDGVPVADAPVFVSDDDTGRPPSPTGVSLSLTPTRIKEDGGKRAFSLTVSLLGGTLQADTAVQGSCGPSAGDAARLTIDIDCPASFQFTFPAGAEIASTIFQATAIDDSEAEGDETISIGVAFTDAATGNAFSANTALTIVDDEGASPSSPVTGDEEASPSSPVTGSGGGVEPTFTVYHDPDHSAEAVSRYNTAEGLLDAAGRQYVVRIVTGTGEVDQLAGVSNSVMPRFFLGDPTDPAWGPSQPQVNNGGLRWLSSMLAQSKAVAGGEPVAIGLAPNFPNPFNSSTQIVYRLASPGPVRLGIYNTLGQPVLPLVDEFQAADSYRVQWDARDQQGASLSSGIYIVRLVYPGGVETRRVLYLK